MKLMALMVVLMGLAMSGSAKAAQVQTCGMVIRVGTEANRSVVVVNTAENKKVAGAVELKFFGAESQLQIASNAQILSLATTAINNPGSLDFCMKTDGGKIVSATISNRFKK